jgi:hypothetical protein
MSSWYFKDNNPVKTRPHAIMAITSTQHQPRDYFLWGNLKRVLLQTFHLNVTKCTLICFPKICYLISNYLPNSVQHSHSQEANSFSASQEIPTFYEIQKFITTFTKAHHLSPFWARVIQSTPSPHISLRFILFVSSHLHLGLPRGSLPSCFPTKTLYRWFSFYARSRSWKTSHKSNTKFPLKTMYFLGVRALTTSSYIVYDLPLVDIQTCTVYEYMYCIYSRYTFLYSIHTFLYNIFIYF